jgi:hypothetical protein
VDLRSRSTVLGPTKDRPKAQLQEKTGRRGIAEPEAQVLWLLRNMKTFRLSLVYQGGFKIEDLKLAYFSGDSSHAEREDSRSKI